MLHDVISILTIAEFLDVSDQVLDDRSGFLEWDFLQEFLQNPAAEWIKGQIPKKDKNVENINLLCIFDCLVNDELKL